MKVYYSCENPSRIEIEAVDQLAAITEDDRLQLDYIIVIGNRIAAVMPSGGRLDYIIDQRTGDLITPRHKDDRLDGWISNRIHYVSLFSELHELENTMRDLRN